RGHRLAAGATACAFSLAVTDGRQRDLALRIDVVHAHGDLVAEVEDVLDPLDALAATQLGDVHEAVTAGKDVDEGAELGDVHDLARVRRPHLGLGRIEDEFDATPCLLDLASVL